MGFNKRQVDYNGRYPRMYVLKYLPLLGSVIVASLLTFAYTIYLMNQVILTDSMLPIIEANRFDNLLFWMFSSMALCILTYVILIPFSQGFHNSHTTSSKIPELFESAKSKMGIDFEVDLRVNREGGIILTSYRNPFKASVVISSRTQSLILQEKELGEAIIANELGFLKNFRPWLQVVAAVIFGSIIAGSLLPKPSAIDYPGLFEFTLATIIGTLPLILMFVGMHLYDSASGNKSDSALTVKNEYQVIPSYARMALLEGIAIRRSDIEKRDNSDSNNGSKTDYDNTE